MQPTIIQIATGHYSFYNEKERQVLQSFNVIGLDDKGDVYIFVQRDKKWVNIEQYGTADFNIYSNSYKKSYPQD